MKKIAILTNYSKDPDHSVTRKIADYICSRGGDAWLPDFGEGLGYNSNRLAEEKSTVTTLASENENVDITNIAVEVKEAELVYNAALMATGKINQRSLIDYI